MYSPGFGTKMWPLLLFLLALTPQSPAAPRDSRPSTPATGTISGRITDRESGRPIPGALINARGADQADAVTTRADGDGRYEISGLAPGKYTVWASPGELRVTHLQQAFGRSAPIDMFAGPPPPNLTLKAGDVRSDLDIALVRTLAIEGRVLDPLDEPMADVGVDVTHADGAPVSALSVFSNDRGEYRLFGLAPGRYHVCASPQTQFDGDSSAPTRFVRTCHLASVLRSGAVDVVLERSDVAGTDIRVQRGATFSVSGTVVDSSGTAVENVSVSAQSDDRSVSMNGQTQQGRFVLKGLPSGRYLLRVSTGGPDNPDDRRASVREPEAAEAIVAIGGGDVADVALILAKAWHVAGRVVFQDGLPLPASRLRLWVGLMTLGDPWMDSERPTLVDEALAFELKSLNRRPSAVFIQGLPEGWVLKSVRYDGRDFIGMPIDFASATPQSQLQIVVTSHVARASIRVVGLDDRPATSYQPILITADPRPRTLSHWYDTTKSHDGVLKLGPALPGEYLIVAVSLDDYRLLQVQPERLDDLVPLAQRVTLVEGKDQTFDVKLVALPPRQ
jgi:hypothetical protein